MEMAGLPVTEAANKDAGYGVIENLLDIDPDAFNEKAADKAMEDGSAQPADVIASLEAKDWASNDEEENQWFNQLIAYLKIKDPSLNIKKATKAVEVKQAGLPPGKAYISVDPNHPEYMKTYDRPPEAPFNAQYRRDAPLTRGRKDQEGETSEENEWRRYAINMGDKDAHTYSTWKQKGKNFQHRKGIYKR